eukprot:3057056-Pleurochrysis_carterae.AAC.2
MPPFGSCPPYALSKRITVPSSLHSRSALWEQMRRSTPHCSFTPGLAPNLRSLADLRCEHQSHISIAGGQKIASGWSSAHTAAYPPDLNFLLARVFALAAPISPTTTRTADASSVAAPVATTAVPGPVSATSNDIPTIAPSADATTVAQPDSATERPERAPFQRGLGEYPLRGRQP